MWHIWHLNRLAVSRMARQSRKQFLTQRAGLQNSFQIKGLINPDLIGFMGFGLISCNLDFLMCILVIPLNICPSKRHDVHQNVCFFCQDLWLLSGAALWHCYPTIIHKKTIMQHHYQIKLLWGKTEQFDPEYLSISVLESTTGLQSVCSDFAGLNVVLLLFQPQVKPQQVRAPYLRGAESRLTNLPSSFALADVSGPLPF